jgi:hypothetical protein
VPLGLKVTSTSVFSVGSELTAHQSSTSLVGGSQAVTTPRSNVLLAPERFHLVQPVPQLLEGLVLQRVDAGARVVLRALLADQPRPAQHAEVAAHRGAAHLEGLSDLAGAARAVPQEVDHPTPGRLGQRGQGTIEATFHRAGAA